MTKLDPKLKTSSEGPRFSADCKKCPRLAVWLEQVRQDHPEYYAKPVNPFGDEKPKLLIVGLAPGMHGANRTGRPFTGDYAGILLYQTLFDYGFASRPDAVAIDDGLALTGCRITNAVKCLPPENKPLPAEVRTCNGYLRGELATLDSGNVVLALGQIAHQAVLMALGLKLTNYRFSHGAKFLLPGELVLFDSYHCSRYNTQTKRLTSNMFSGVFKQIRSELDVAEQKVRKSNTVRTESINRV